jgi:hypothetical protein
MAKRRQTGITMTKRRQTGIKMAKRRQTCINTIAESKRPVVLEAKPNNRRGTNSDTSFQK